MNPMFLVSWSNLKTKKTQNAVIAVIILLSALLLTTAAVVLTNTDGYFDDIHLSANGSHTLLQFENGLHDPEAVHAWWSEQEGVEMSSLFRYVSLTQLIHEGNEVGNITLYMTNAGENPLASPVDRLIFANRDNPSPVPEPGTVWIPTSLAYSQSIEPGDILAFKWAGEVFSYRVSGIVVDLPFSQPFTVTARLWMNQSDYARLTAAGDAQEKALMGIRFADPAEDQTYWERFAEHFGTPFLETVTDYAGPMGLFILGIAYGITYSVNRLHVKRDGRVLGIYRSLGMTAGRLRLAILSGTAVQTIAGTLLGLIIGTVFMPNLLDTLLQNYGIVEFPMVWNTGSLAAAAAAGCVSMLFGSWLASVVVKKQSLRSLVEETYNAQY